MSTIRVQALPKFPASIEAGDGITIERSGGVFTFSLDQSSSPTFTGNVTLAPTSGPALTITPAVNTIDRAIDITQVGPTGSTPGPIYFNRINATYEGTTTPWPISPGDDSDFGNWIQRVTAFGVDFNVGGADLTGESIVSGIFQIRHTADSDGGDMVALSGVAYSNAISSGIFGIYGGAFGSIVESGGHTNFLVGIEIDNTLRGTGTANNRSGVNVTNQGTKQATGIDAAITIASAISSGSYKNGITLMPVGSAVPLDVTGDLINASAATTLANIFSMSNVTVTGNILNFPNARMSGAGMLRMGSAASGLFSAAARNLIQASVASGGNVSVISDTNSTAGLNGLDISTSAAGTGIAIVANEAANTATVFGQTSGNWGEIVTYGAPSNGLLLGTLTNKPIVFGANNAERMRLLTGLAVGHTTDPGAGFVSALTGIIAPTHSGGAAASSTLTLASTSGAGTSDAIRFQTGSQVHAGGINTSGQWSFGPNVAPNTGVKLTVNKNTVAPAATVGGNVLAQFTGANTTQPVVLFDSFGSNGISEGFLSFRTARGTQASYTATQNNDFIGFISMVGASGANTFVDCVGGAGGVYIGGQATENWSGTNQGAKLGIFTTVNGAALISQAAQFAAGFSVGTTSDPGAGMIYTNAATFMIRTKTSYTSGAGTGTVTILNAPGAGAIGNPTKWIPIDDNGTTRYVPAW